jgi:replicative DNA helicase
MGDYDHEAALLSAILIDNAKLNDCRTQINEQDFGHARHAVIWHAMCALDDDNKAIDLITLRDALKTSGELNTVGGVTTLMHIQEFVPSAANYREYIQITLEHSRRRAVDSTAAQVLDELKSDDKVEALGRIEDIVKGYDQIGRPTYWTLEESIMEALEKVHKLNAHDGELTGLPSGLTDLDHLTCGFQDSELIVIAERPGLGKTSLALQIAIRTAQRTGKRVAFFSLEMARVAITQRILCTDARIDSNVLRAGRMSIEEEQRMAQSAERNAPLPIIIEDRSDLTLDNIRSMARSLTREKEVSLIIIDYLQLMKGQRRDGRQQEIAEISRGLKGLAKELDIPIVALAQLNRQSELRTDKRPLLADLRESGQIEQDADLVIFLYRDELVNPDSMDTGIAELIVAKHRNGPTGSVRVRFEPTWTRFDNLAPVEQEAHYG